MKNKENLTSEIREGTRCQFCGEKIINGEDFIHCNGGAKGSIIYGHRDCAREYSYHERYNTNRKHIKTLSGFCWGAEFETNQATTEEERLYLYANYGLICTADCTVTEEFISPIIQGLHGGKKYLEGIYKVLDIANGDNVGTHLNFSLAKWSGISIAEYGDCLDELADYMRYNLTHNQLVEVFGRGFSTYAEFTDYNYVHGKWLNLGHNGRVELRLAKFKNVQQYFYLACMCKEWALIIDDYIEGKFNCEKTGKRLIKALNNRLSGKAKYMRPERNK